MGEKPTETDEAARSNLNSSKSNLAREGSEPTEVDDDTTRTATERWDVQKNKPTARMSATSEAGAPADIAIDEPGVTTNIAVSDPGSPADKR
jgi:hypothetical protein